MSLGNKYRWLYGLLMGAQAAAREIPDIIFFIILVVLPPEFLVVWLKSVWRG